VYKLLQRKQCIVIHIKSFNFVIVIMLIVKSDFSTSNSECWFGQATDEN